MAKIIRATQKIFGSSAQSTQITAFGTAMLASPTYTTDVSQIMNNNFLAGWSSALTEDEAPYEEDTNGVLYAITSQIAYLYQQGIPEWDAATEYNEGSLIQVVENNELVIKKSVISSNIGQSTSNTNYWVDYYKPSMLSGLITSINNKANVSLDNVATTSGFRKLVDSYSSGASWFKIFKEYNSAGNLVGQWCEQGSMNQQTSRDTQVTLLVNYKDTNYSIQTNGQVTTASSSGYYAAVPIISSSYLKTVSSFCIDWGHYASHPYVYWETKGYIS